MKMDSVISEEDIALESESTPIETIKTMNFHNHEYSTVKEPIGRIYKNKKSNDGGNRFSVDLELHENLLNSPPETKVYSNFQE